MLPMIRRQVRRLSWHSAGATWVVAACCAIGVPTFAQGTSETVTVCQVLSDPEKFTGRLLRVEGRLVSNRHGPNIEPADCVPEKEPVSKSICLLTTAWPGDLAVAFTTAGEAIHIAANAARSFVEEDTGFESTAVFEGQVFVSARPTYCPMYPSRVALVAKELVSYAAKRKPSVKRGGRGPSDLPLAK
jgi:hypothetical protein